MLQHTGEKGKAAGWRPTAKKNVDPQRNYRNGGVTSRPNRLQRAAAVLLQLEDGGEIAERQGLWQTFATELEHAYGGCENG